MVAGAARARPAARLRGAGPRGTTRPPSPAAPAVRCGNLDSHKLPPAARTPPAPALPPCAGGCGGSLSRLGLRARRLPSLRRPRARRRRLLIPAGGGAGAQAGLAVAGRGLGSARRYRTERGERHRRDANPAAVAKNEPGRAGDACTAKLGAASGQSGVRTLQVAF
ncbi:hypothetical protein H8959_014111 [Pygathrix nigripes]